MLGEVISNAPLILRRIELWFSFIIMYVLLLVLLNVVFMVSLRIQTSVTMWAVILWVPLMKQKTVKRVITERQRDETRTQKQLLRYEGGPDERQTCVKK